MKNIFTGLFLILSCVAISQNVAINATGAAPAASAMLDIASTTSGLLIPRMTTAQRIAIAAPATGLKVYDTTTGTFWYFNGTIWVEILNGNIGWRTTGNTLTGAGILGSLSNDDVLFYSNNVERMRWTNTGRLGIYNAAPTTWIHFTPTSAISNFQSMWDNTLNADAIARFQHTNAANSNRVLLSVTNYNASAFLASALTGISLNTAGAGAEGVRGVCNGAAQTGVFAGNQNATGITTGWGLYSNNWAGGATAWQNVSDSRLKKNVLTINDAVNKVKNLRGVEYYFDTDKYPDINLPENKQYGFIAQEVEQVLPEIVREAKILGNQNLKATNEMNVEAKTYDLKVLSYTYVVPVLVEAIKDQQKQIEELKKELELLKKRN